MSLVRSKTDELARLPTFSEAEAAGERAVAAQLEPLIRAVRDAPLTPPPADDAGRPKVLLLITLAELGGAQAYVASLLPALTPSFDVVVAAHGQGPLREAASRAGVRFVPLRHVRRPVSPWRDAAGLVELIRLFRRERPDILHASSSKAGILGRLAAAAAHVPVRIFTVHGWAFSAYPGLVSTVYRWADRVVSPLTTQTICVSENERATGIRAGTCCAERTVVIRNAVDVSAAPRSRHNGAVPRLIAVGRLKAPKDFLTFVRALDGLAPGSFEALIVGDGPERPVVEEEVRRLGLRDRVRLVGAREDVPALLAGSDVFVLSSASEGLPMCVLEAMAAELPVVASAVGGVAELVVEGETGLLVPPGDPDRLGAALAGLLADADLRRRLGASGRARAEALFDLPAFRRAHLDLYRAELVASRMAPQVVRAPGPPVRRRTQRAAQVGGGR
jgi:glycosyltransferase involved in cell wall biosynthesis